MIVCLELNRLCVKYNIDDIGKLWQILKINSPSNFFLEIYDEKSDEKLSLVNVIIVDTAVTSSFGWKGLLIILS